MRRSDLEARVRRLYSGDQRIEDLNRIFAWLRFRSRGRASLSEIGHFAAHPDIRDKGVTFSRAADLFHSSTLLMRSIHFSSLGQHDTYDDSMHRPAIEARLRLYGARRIKKELGVDFKKAQKLLQSGLDKLALDPSINMHGMQKDEWIVLNFFVNNFRYDYLFSDVTLLKDLTEVLRFENLLGESGSIDIHRDFIGLYAASIMHLVEIKLADSITGHLHAGHDNDGSLCVSLSSPMSSLPFIQNDIRVSCVVFKTRVRLSRFCEIRDLPDQGVFSPENPNYSLTSAYWNSPIELGDNGRISVIR